MLGRILCTCTAAKLPLRFFLGRSCKSVYHDAPDNYFCSISVGKTDFLGAPNRTHSNSCFVHPLPQQSRDSCYIFASLKYSAFMQLIMVHWCGGFGDEQCWVVPWTPNEDFVCITSHARSTAATSFTCAVTSDGVHRIMACWVLLLQSFGAEQHGHTRWPTNIFAHACVEVEHISILVPCLGPSMKTLSVLHHMHRAHLPHLSPVR